MLGALIGAAASLGSSFLSNKASQKNAQAQADLQRQFAQSGIQWKVADAKKAGVHPLYALGAQTHSYAPVSVGSDYSGLASAGQQIGRAVDAATSPQGKLAQFQQSLLAAQVEGAHLDNDIKRAKLASDLAVRSSGPGRGVPLLNSSGGYDGQGNAIGLQGNNIKLETRRDVADPQSPQYIPGSGPSVGFVKNSTGGYSPVIPPELAESYESDWLGSIDWMMRNRIAPYLGYVKPPNVPHNPLTEDVVWRGQEWVVVPKKMKYLNPSPRRSYGRNN